jgi:hypothetical protein
VTDADLADEHDLLDEQLEDFNDRKFSIRIVKAGSEEALKFLTVDGFGKSLQSEPKRFEQSTEVVIAELAHDFKCDRAGVKVGPWPDDWTPSITAEKDETPPRRLVNDMSGKGLLPISPRAWIIDETTDVWWNDKIRKTAVNRLALCIPDAISVDRWRLGHAPHDLEGSACSSR